MTVSLQDVWSAATAFADARGTDPAYVFDDCGLRLEWPPKRWEYFCTPENSLTFASTGGDGVHFGILAIPGLEDSRRPVVMTVPMSDEHNVIVAENLDEFLGLGYYVGWFSLDQLVYGPEEAFEYYSGPDPQEWPEREQALEFLRRTLKFQPVRLSQSRMAELKQKYIQLVVARNEPVESEWRAV